MILVRMERCMIWMMTAVRERKGLTIHLILKKIIMREVIRKTSTLFLIVLSTDYQNYPSKGIDKLLDFLQMIIILSKKIDNIHSKKM